MSCWRQCPRTFTNAQEGPQQSTAISLTFRTRNLGRRRGPQNRIHHKNLCPLTLMSSLECILSTTMRKMHKSITLYIRQKPGPCFLESLTGYETATQQPICGTSPKPLGKIPQLSERKEERSPGVPPCKGAHLTLYRSLLLCSQDLVSWNRVLLPTLQESILIGCIDLLHHSSGAGGAEVAEHASLCAQAVFHGIWHRPGLPSLSWHLLSH